MRRKTKNKFEIYDSKIESLENEINSLRNVLIKIGQEQFVKNELPEYNPFDIVMFQKNDYNRLYHMPIICIVMRHEISNFNQYDGTIGFYYTYLISKNGNFDPEYFEYVNGEDLRLLTDEEKKRYEDVIKRLKRHKVEVKKNDEKIKN